MSARAPSSPTARNPRAAWSVPVAPALYARLTEYAGSAVFSAAIPGLSHHWNKRLRQLDIALESDALQIVNTSIIGPPIGESSTIRDLLLQSLDVRTTASDGPSRLSGEFAAFRALDEVARAEIERLVRRWPYRMLHALRGAAVILQHAEPGSPGRLLSIGSGHCLTVLILGRHFGWRSTVIDLPQQVLIGAAILAEQWPEAMIQLPNERSEEASSDVEYLTPQQVEAIPRAAFDVAENSFSFGEMNIETVVDYFAVIRRACRPTGLLYSLNREQKVCDFADYPFQPSDEFLMDVTHPQEPEWMWGESFAGGPTREVVVRFS